ncbi:T9SS type A sorting domain-containing protein [Lacinutrix chionoecetis]
MKKITLLTLLMLPLVGLAQVTNSTFDSDINGWVDNNATSSWSSTEGDAAPGSITFTTGGNNNGRINTSPNVGPDDGPGDYVLTFSVKGTMGTTVRGAIFQGGATNGIDIDLAADDTWETYTHTFTGITTDNMNVRVFGRTPNSTYFVDDVTFTIVPCTGFTILPETDGGGTNVITAPSACYLTGDSVEFTATPACANFTFNEWVVNGAPAGNMNPLNYTVGSADATVTATFTPVSPAPDLNFDTTAELSNWSGNSSATATAANDDLTVSISGVVPKITYNCAIAPTSWNINSVKIGYDNQSPNTVLRFKHPKFSGGDNYIDETITANGTGVVEIPLTNPDWVDNMDLIEILFRNAGNTDASNGDIIIDYIEFFNNPLLSVDEFSTTNVSIFPNPATDVLTINSDREIINISVYDITGKKVISNDNLTNNTLNVSALNTGVYLLNLTDSNKNSVTKKLVIK